MSRRSHAYAGEPSRFAPFESSKGNADLLILYSSLADTSLFRYRGSPLLLLPSRSEIVLIVSFSVFDRYWLKGLEQRKNTGRKKAGGCVCLQPEESRTKDDDEDEEDWGRNQALRMRGSSVPKRLSWTNRCLRALRNRPRRRPRGRSFSVAGQKRFWGDKHGQGNKRILLGAAVHNTHKLPTDTHTSEAVNKTVDKIVKNV